MLVKLKFERTCDKVKGKFNILSFLRNIPELTGLTLNLPLLHSSALGKPSQSVSEPASSATNPSKGVKRQNDSNPTMDPIALASVIPTPK